MKKIIVAILFILPGINVLAEKAGSITNECQHIYASDYPSVASRVPFFEERINAEDSAIRIRALTESSYFHHEPTTEYVLFLKRLYLDPNPEVRGIAIRKLYDMWVPQPPESLPQVFTGYDGLQIIDRNSRIQTQGMYAPYAYGLIGNTNSIPVLKKYINDENIFVRYSAARALLSCGDRSSAVAIFNKISENQLAIYATGDTEDNTSHRKASPHYAILACQGLMKSGGDEYITGLDRLIKLMGYFEWSEDVNDQSQLHYLRSILSAHTGQFFNSSINADAWLKKNAINIAPNHH